MIVPPHAIAGRDQFQQLLLRDCQDFQGLFAAQQSACQGAIRKLMPAHAGLLSAHNEICDYTGWNNAGKATTPLAIVICQRGGFRAGLETLASECWPGACWGAVCG